MDSDEIISEQDSISSEGNQQMQVEDIVEVQSIAKKKRSTQSSDNSAESKHTNDKKEENNESK